MMVYSRVVICSFVIDPASFATLILCMVSFSSTLLIVLAGNYLSRNILEFAGCYYVKDYFLDYKTSIKFVE